MKILFIHQNYPGQFRQLAPALSQLGHDLRAVSMRKESLIAGVQNHSYRPARASSKDIHPWLVSTETAVLRGEAAASRIETLCADGWEPDVAFGHTGWGEMLFLREVLPNTRILGLNELFYRKLGGDIGFDPEFPSPPYAPKRLYVRNMHLLTSLLNCDVAITPTHWQASCFPEAVRSRLQVIHEGIRTDLLQPNPNAWVGLPRDGGVLRVGDEVVTFINRNLEPMRGYHQFMRALPDILQCRPRAQVVIVGGDGVSYGPKPQNDKGYKEKYLNEVRDRLDMSRVHFVGQLPYPVLMNLLRVSAVHVYLTAPFVLSWSVLEAMSLGALVVGSDTAPVREVISEGRNGLLVDFFNPTQLAETVCKVLANPEKFKHLRAEARQTVVNRYDFQQQSLPRYLNLMHT